MSRNTKIILGVVGGIILLCICIGVGGTLLLRTVGTQIGQNMTTEDPAQAQQIGQGMLDYQLPEGYSEMSGFNFLVGKMVFISRGSVDDTTDPIIMMFQMNVGLDSMDPDQMRQQMQQSLEQGMQRANFNLQLDETTTASVRGQTINVYHYSGTTDEGTRIRQVVTDPIEGKSGVVMIMVTGADATWNDTLVENFLAGIQ